MRVLGIDCGTERTGYGVIDSDGRAHRMIAAGFIRTVVKSPFESRLREISRETWPGLVHGAQEEKVVQRSRKRQWEVAHKRVDVRNGQQRI